MDKSPERKANSTASTTARPSFASSRRNRIAHPESRLLTLVAGLTDAENRLTAAQALARYAGAHDLIVFVRDAEIGVLLPAPGFQQTLPNAKRWHEFLETSARHGFAEGELPFPDDEHLRNATGIAADDGSVVTFLGGQHALDQAIDISLLLPIVAAAFHGERTASVSAGQATVAKAAAHQARLLAASLDKARGALRHTLAEAQRANAAKDRFLAVLSHELRTPLNPVLMAASAMETDPNLPQEIRADISMIRRNVELEANLIDDLLDLTRVSNGKVQLQKKVTDAHELLEEAIAVVRGDSSAAQPPITVELNATRHFIDADPARMQQVVWNLIRNAVKFTPAQGTVTIRTTDAGPDKLRVEVIDTGRGIAPEALPRIFRAFEQGEPEVNRQFGGLGLGLAISKALVDLHEGELRAESDGLGHGARFILELEVVRNVAAAIPARVASVLRSATRRRILLVEDHETSGALMLRLLLKRGHEVELTRTKASAVVLGRKKQFDVLISDLGLPDGNGYEVMEALREGSSIVGIALSGYGMEGDIERGTRAGFSFHLTKPIDSQKLYETIEQIPAISDR